jgi:hypothetical protein
MITNELNIFNLNNIIQNNRFHWAHRVERIVNSKWTLYRSIGSPKFCSEIQTILTGERNGSNGPNPDDDDCGPLVCDTEILVH